MTQTAIDPADAIQEGVYQLLTADATLDGLVSGVYDGVPEDVEPAYVVIGEASSVPDGAHNSHGRQTSLTTHTWTRAEGMSPGNAIAGRIVALLWHRHAELDAVVDGHKVWRIEHEYSQTIDDPQPGIRHRVDRFRVWSSQEGA